MKRDTAQRILPPGQWARRGNCLGQFQFHRHMVEAICNDLVMWAGRGTAVPEAASAAAGVNALAELDRVLAGLNRFRDRLSAEIELSDTEPDPSGRAFINRGAGRLGNV